MSANVTLVQEWRRAVTTWTRHIERAVIERCASDVQVELDAAGVIPYGGSITIMLMRRWIDDRPDDEADEIMASILLACWNHQPQERLS